MADDKKDKQIDETLDLLLAKYSSVEPRSGLETRILATLRDRAHRKESHAWWELKWMWVGMATAAIIIAAGLINERRHVAPPANVVVKTNQPATQPGMQSHVRVANEEAAMIHRQKPPLPKQKQNMALAIRERPAVFPTPSPLSEQERLLFTYLANTPQEVVVAQIPPHNDQKEADAFWASREQSSGNR